VSAGKIKIVLLVLGLIVVLVAFGAMAAGGSALWANSNLKDDEGYFSTETILIDKDSHAIVTEPAGIDLEAAWIWDWSNLATIKVGGSNDNSSKQIFIGIAEESDLNDYLSDVEYDEITEFSIYPYNVEYTNHPGDSEPGAPTSQTFWIASAHGDGTQTLEWELEAGTYSLVLMNADGSADVDLSVMVSAKIPWLFGVGVGLLVGGIVALLLGALMIVQVVRRS